MKEKTINKKCLFDVVNKTIEIDPLYEAFNPEQFFSGMFTTNPWMGDVFEHEILKQTKTFKKRKVVSLKSMDLKKPATDDEIIKIAKIKTFGINDILWIIAGLMETDELQKENRHANLFYVKKGKDIFVIHLLWWEKGIRIFCWRFGYHGPHWPNIWPKDSTRVFISN